VRLGERVDGRVEIGVLLPLGRQFEAEDGLLLLGELQHV